MARWFGRFDLCTKAWGLGALAMFVAALIGSMGIAITMLVVALVGDLLGLRPSLGADVGFASGLLWYPLGLGVAIKAAYQGFPGRFGGVERHLPDTMPR